MLKLLPYKLTFTLVPIAAAEGVIDVSVGAGGSVIEMLSALLTGTRAVGQFAVIDAVPVDVIRLAGTVALAEVA